MAQHGCDLRCDVSPHCADQIRLVLWRRERAGGGDFLKSANQHRNEFFSRKDLRKRPDGPFDVVMAAEESQDRFDGVLTLFNEHPHDHPLFFDVLRHDVAGHGESLQQCIQCIRCAPLRELLRGLDSGPIFAARLRQPLHQLIDLL